MLAREQIGDFIIARRLPVAFQSLADEHYTPLAAWIRQKKRPNHTLVIGINGAQGSGKSTLAEFLKLTIEDTADWRVAILAIDDFYLTKAERYLLAERIHPLLQTRGVPGTHDMQLLFDRFTRIKDLEAGSTVDVPVFDKAKDERVVEEDWHTVTGPVDLIVLEGWCVGSLPQPDCELKEPANTLEAAEDAGGEWRAFVNQQLAGAYARLREQLDVLIYLKVPNFDAVYRWRLEQEEKLATTACEDSTELMDRPQISRFIQHFERITKADLRTLPVSADVVLEFDDNHDCVQSKYC